MVSLLYGSSIEGGMMNIIAYWCERFFALCVLIFLMPLFLFISVLIRAESPGPVFFIQRRVGWHCSKFSLYKFRTMKAKRSENGPLFTLANDGRLTDVGRILRQYKIDELPQLINIVKGDMAFVGPRPIVPELAALHDQDNLQIMFKVRPGVTGPASLEFRHEGQQLAQSDDPHAHYCQHLPEKEELGIAYISQKSILFDLKVILRTIWAVLR